MNVDTFVTALYALAELLISYRQEKQEPVLNVLAKLHEGHSFVVKCKERPRQSVWCPGLSQQVNEMVFNCITCIQERQNHREPLMPSGCPDRPRQTLRVDLFVLKSKTYLLIIYHFSRYVEIAALSHSRFTDIIVHFKPIFAGHGGPNVGQ